MDPDLGTGAGIRQKKKKIIYIFRIKYVQQMIFVIKLHNKSP